MGKFAGTLLCSDFDMTLAQNEVISPENAAAIRYFTENGGLFTIVSGRHPGFLQEHIGDFQINAPLVGYNGALILDHRTGETLYEGGRPDFEMFEFLRPFWEKDLRLRRLIPHDRKRRVPRCTRKEYPTTINAVKKTTSLPLFNVLCITAPEDSEDICGALNAAAAGTPFIAVRSWNAGTELICRADEKGEAVLRLKKMTGARLLVTAGDYENDISMLKSADIGYAVGNAIPAVKAAADRVTVPCEGHAIAAIITDLENKKEILENS